jgi:hypothetical protein
MKGMGETVPAPVGDDTTGEGDDATGGGDDATGGVAAP